MIDFSDPVGLAHELAAIAAGTHDPETAMRLMVLVEALLAEAGLGGDTDRAGTGSTPPRPGTNERARWSPIPGRLPAETRGFPGEARSRMHPWHEPAEGRRG